MNLLKMRKGLVPREFSVEKNAIYFIAETNLIYILIVTWIEHKSFVVNVIRPLLVVVVVVVSLDGSSSASSLFPLSRLCIETASM